MSQKLKHIAVIRLSAMGDVAMTVPVLAALAKKYPLLKITMVSKPFYKPMFDGIANLDFIAFDSKAKHKGILGLLKFYRELTQADIDAFADLHNVLRSKILRALFALSGIRTAATDKGKADRKALTRPGNKIFKPLEHMVCKHLQTFATLGLPLNFETLDCLPKRELGKNAMALCGTKKTDQWIGIAPFAQHDSKVYPLDLMRKTVNSLAEKPNRKIFLFGAAADEITRLKSFAATDENIVIVAGKLSFAEELQLISNLDLMIGMDSGNAHISAMFGVPTITLWGATHPYAGFSPFRQPFENAIVSDRQQYPKLPTSVYGNKKVAGYERAMRTILPETIVSKVESMLNANAL